MTAAGYVLLLLADRPDIPADLWVFLLAVLGLYVVAHLAVRRFAPRADPTLLPIAFLLNGIGYFTISRLDRDLARVQAVWTAVGIGAFVLTLMVVRNVRTLERYKYTFLLLGVAALLLPLAARHRAGDQRRAAVGAPRTGELPARRSGQGAARHLLRRVPRRQARAARRRAPATSAACGSPTRSTSGRCCSRGASPSS